VGTPRGTLILPNYNNERALPHVFAALRAHADCSRLAFVMVDDGSEDASVRVAKQHASACGFVSCEIIERAHEGIVPTLNTALDAARTEWIIRIDGDATVETPGWVEMLYGLLAHDDVGAVGGHIAFYDGRVHSLGRSVCSEAGLFDMGTCPLEPIGRRTFDSLVLRPRAAFTTGPPYEVDTVLGVCVAFRTAEAKAAGGFDMRFNPVWIEDDDFGLALRRLGKRILVTPNVHVVHRTNLRGTRHPGAVRDGSGAPSPGVWAPRQLLAKLAPPALKRARRALLSRLAPPPPRPKLEDLLPRESNEWRVRTLRSHYAAWRDKWGFDPLNPDLAAIHTRYWETALCWRLNPHLLEASRGFLGRVAGASG
jgi:GT2 family glycosyltransferase